MDFSDYKTKAEYAYPFNQGYSARLSGKPISDNPFIGKPGIAWTAGWNKANEDAGGED